MSLGLPMSMTPASSSGSFGASWATAGGLFDLIIPAPFNLELNLKVLKAETEGPSHASVTNRAVMEASRQYILTASF